MNLAEIITELVEERGLDRTVLHSIIAQAMLTAYQKKYPEFELKAEYEPKTGSIAVFAKKTVVTTVKDEDKEIGVKKARSLDKNLELDDSVWVPFEGKIGRIEILRARQVIASEIRKIEAAAIHNEFKDRQGEIVHGVIHKCERGGTAVKIDDYLAFLPKTFTIPGDKCIVGFPIRALLKEVLTEPKNDNQLVLDRTSEDFLRNLFELEIPEVFEKIVGIKKIARIPGYKSKVIVFSNDENIDPVGTCVGIGGGRIKPILKELSGEKIDVIPWSESLEMLIKNALKPAQIDRIELADDNKTAKVWLDEDQRAFAIGKMGQNIALASRVTGVDIQLMQQEKTQDQEESG